MTISKEHQEDLAREYESEMQDQRKKEMQPDDYVNCEICNCVVYKKDAYQMDDLSVCEECYYND